MNRLKRIGAVMQKEVLHVFRDKIAFMIAFVAPFLLVVLCGFIYIQQKVTQLPVVIFDQDQTELSRTIIRSFADSERLKIVKTVDNYSQIEKALQTETAYLAVVIPNDLEKDVKKGRSTEVALITNSSNILIMNTVATAAGQVVQTISAGVTMKIMQGYGLTPAKALQAVSAISFRTRNWYNPTASYLVFMLLGLIGTVVQQVTFLGVALAFVREKEGHTWQSLILSKLKWSDLLSGKLLVHFLVFSMVGLVSYWIGINCFGLPLRGNIWLMMFTIELFILVLLAMGLAISLVAANAPQAIEISMMIAVPSFLISGYTWPYLSMPGPIQFLSRLLPLSHFLEAMRAIVYMGAGFQVVASKLMILGLFLLVFLPLNAWLLQLQMKKTLDH